jgi:hypothetical protein
VQIRGEPRHRQINDTEIVNKNLQGRPGDIVLLAGSSEREYSVAKAMDTQM